MPTVFADGRALDCAPGTPLRDVLRAAGIPVYADRSGLVNCHGLGTCGTCALAVCAPDFTPLDPAGGALSAPTAIERWRLSFSPHDDALRAGLRLACQARVHDDVRVVRRGGFWGHAAPTPPPMNVDLGEHPDEPLDFWSYADQANIACGGHAGDRASMERALVRCKLAEVAAGAHPSYPDRERFGRVRMDMSPAALEEAVAAQLDALIDEAAALQVTIRHVKPHGALYHAADGDDALADAVVRPARALFGTFVTIVGPAVGASPTSGALGRAAARFGLAYAREAFADRGVDARGALLPRSAPGALLTDPAAAAARARQLVGWCDTLCVHGDTPGALAILRAVREALGPRRMRGA